MPKTEDINDWTREDFRSLPIREDWKQEIECSSIIILPCNKIHDSGYRCLDFVAVVDGKPIMRLSGWSDVLHINGIGGFGYNWLKKYETCPRLIPPIDWNIDCLATSGLIQIFTHRHKIIAGIGLSSFEIFAKEKNNES